MHLMYYINEKGEREYTLAKHKNGKATRSAHPARYSPDDDEARYRVAIRQRYAPRFDAYEILTKGNGARVSEAARKNFSMDLVTWATRTIPTETKDVDDGASTASN